MIDYTFEEIFAAIKGSKAIISTIAKKLNCEWHTAKAYIEKYPLAQQALQDEIDKNKDIAENTILSAIDLGDIQTAKWYLQTIGKDRGYSEKTEIQHSGDITVNVKYE